jgi:hypothetical protein
MKNMDNEVIKAVATLILSVIMMGLSFQIDQPVFGMSVFFARGLVFGLALSAIIATVSRLKQKKQDQQD